MTAHENALLQGFFRAGAVIAYRTDKPYVLLDRKKLEGTASAILDHVSAKHRFIVYHLESHSYRGFKKKEDARRDLADRQRL